MPPPQAPAVRPARRNELADLRDIERAAGERYRAYGLGFVADDEPLGVEVLAAYAADGRAWVAVDGNDRPVGYVLVDVVDGGGHIEQVSVAPSHQGRGMGRALIDQVRGWALENGMMRVTLTTFEHIPWNRPWYEHLGFRVVAGTDIGPELRNLCARETAHGLDQERRVVMRLDLAPVQLDPDW